MDCDFVPKDYKYPDWNKYSKIHNWRNHVRQPIQNIWDTFTDTQKQTIAMCAEEDAMNEEWD